MIEINEKLSKTKLTQIPKDVLALCEEIAKGYQRRKKDFENKRYDVIYFAGKQADYVGGARGNSASDPVARKAERLEALENSLDAVFLRAVEKSFVAIGADVTREMREKLRKAIILNCEDGRKFPYDRLDVSEFTKSDFYRRRKNFVVGIGANLGLVSF
jgi:hypothetical protein